MQKFIHCLLATAILLSYAVGPRVSAELEHAHHGASAHRHLHTGADSSPAHRHGHPRNTHDHGPGPGEHRDHDDSPPAPGGHQQNSEPLSHAHYISFGVDLPLGAPAFPAAPLKACPEFDSLRLESERCPERPFFEMIKPPQLA